MFAGHKRSLQKDPIDMDEPAVDMTELTIVEDERRDVDPRDVERHHQDFLRLRAPSNGARQSFETRTFYTHNNGAAIEEHKLQIKEATRITELFTMLQNRLLTETSEPVKFLEQHSFSCVAANINKIKEEEHSKEYANSSYRCICKEATAELELYGSATAQLEDLSIEELNQKKAHESIEKGCVLEKPFEGNTTAINNNDLGSNNDDQGDHNNQKNQAVSLPEEQNQEIAAPSGQPLPLQ